jgi:hypothetical protein
MELQDSHLKIPGELQQEEIGLSVRPDPRTTVVAGLYEGRLDRIEAYGQLGLLRPRPKRSAGSIDCGIQRVERDADARRQRQRLRHEWKRGLADRLFVVRTKWRAEAGQVDRVWRQGHLVRPTSTLERRQKLLAYLRRMRGRPDQRHRPPISAGRLDILGGRKAQRKRWRFSELRGNCRVVDAEQTRPVGEGVKRPSRLRRRALLLH